EMDDPNITMEEYVQLETERALRMVRCITGKLLCMARSDFSSKPMVSPQHIDEINLKNETSLSENDDEEYNVISFNDLFPFNVFSVNDLKLNTDNDDDKTDIKQSLGNLSIEPLPNGIKSVRYGVSNEFDTAYREFLGVGTTFDIFENIHFLYLQYGILVFSGYGVLIMFPLWSLVSAGTDTSYLHLWIQRIGCQNINLQNFFV
ncbi:hypothetical protein Tco_0347573, partial [Tanacetum coccineum]